MQFITNLNKKGECKGKYMQLTVTQKGQTHTKKKTVIIMKETLHMLLSTEENNNWKLLEGQTDIIELGVRREHS